MAEKENAGVKELSLRPYQLASVQSLREGIKAGHTHQVLNLPTGGGKTVIATHLLREAVQKRSKCAFVVDRVVLIDQVSQAMDDYGVPHGIIQAAHWRWRPYETAQVCSAQTLHKRGFPDDLDLLVIDECHVTHKSWVEYLAAHPKTVVIGLTATGFVPGLGKMFSNIVNVTTTNKLIADGFLVPIRMYAAKQIDMTGAKIVAGEWSEREIEQRGSKIVGDIVAEWASKTQEYFGKPVKTLVFSATVPHGDELCRQFQAAGFNFQQLSYRDGSDDTRRKIIEEFRKPDSTIHGLVSCEVLVKGFDVPDVLCGVSARPYRKSLSSHIQQLGRVMRTSPGKEYSLWLDHTGNAVRFKERTDRIFENGVTHLDTGEKGEKVAAEPTKEEAKEITCQCGYILGGWEKECPSCGKVRRQRSLVEAVPGKLIALDPKQKALPFGAPGDVWKQLCTLALQRKRGDTAKARSFAMAQYREIFQQWPGEPFYPAIDVPVSNALRGKVTSNLIRYRHRIKNERKKSAAGDV